MMVPLGGFKVRGTDARFQAVVTWRLFGSKLQIATNQKTAFLKGGGVIWKSFSGPKSFGWDS